MFGNNRKTIGVFVTRAHLELLRALSGMADQHSKMYQQKYEKETLRLKQRDDLKGHKT